MAKVANYFLMTFHFLNLASTIAGISLFYITTNFRMAGVMTFVLLFTGCFCLYIAWRCDTPTACGCGWALPIGKQPPAVKFLLGIPLSILYGFFQLVLLPLLLNDNKVVDGRANREEETLEVRGYHAKAILGVFEGILCSIVVLYGYLGIDFPTDKNIPGYWLVTPTAPFTERTMRVILRMILALCASSAALGVVELDLSVCREEFRRRATPGQRVAHFIFRVSEITYRVTLHVLYVLFAHSVAQASALISFLPAFLSMCGSWLIVFVLGGNESNSLVRLACSIPCTFVNVYAFIDSPLKRSAARLVRKALVIRNGIELVVLPVTILHLCGYRLMKEEVIGLYWKNPVTTTLLLSSFLVHSIIRIVGSHHMQKLQSHDPNLFMAIEKGDVTTVRTLVQSGGLKTDLDLYDANGMTPLMCAASGGSSWERQLRWLLGMKLPVDDVAQAQICRLLIQASASVDVKTYASDATGIRQLCSYYPHAQNMEWTALHIAASRGSTRTVQELLAHIRDRDAFVDKDGETPLHIAARFGTPDVVRALLQKRPGWRNTPNTSGDIPASVATSERIRKAFLATTESGAQTQPLIPVNPDHVSYKDIRVKRGGARELCIAPGISSFLVARGGGPMMRVFLRPIPEDDEAEEDEEQPQASDGQIDYNDLVPLDKYDYRRGIERTYPLSECLVNPVKKDCRLGRGSYGEVWLCKLRTTGKAYAVKNIAKVREAEHSIEREDQIGSRVRLYPHPCVIELVLIQELADRSLYMMVMEYCPNGSLQDVVKNARDAGGKINNRYQGYQRPPKTMAWIGQVFLGLEHLHKTMNVLLRDLKPDNVVLDPLERAKLTDFGFGRFGAESKGNWTFGSPAGTPGYVSPELIREEAYDTKTDIYSFGVLVWLVLTGGISNGDIKEPTPPRLDFIKRAPRGMQYKIYYDDYLLLRNLIGPRSAAGCWDCDRMQNYSSQFHANAITGPEKDFVLSLIERKPGNRPDHEGIRRHQFMQQLRLPGWKPTKAQVNQWIAESAGPRV